MKKLLVCLFLMSGVTSMIFAQEDVKLLKVDTISPVQKLNVAIPVSHWSFVIKGGVDDYSLAPPAPTYSDRFNPTGGVALEYTLNPLLGLGVEYDYSDYSRPYTYRNNIGDLSGSTNDALLFGSVNLSNAFAPLRSGSWKRLNIYGLVGGGVAVYHGEIDNIAREYEATLVGKLGLSVDYALSKVLDLTLEGKYHQYDVTSMCRQSVSTRCGSAMLLTAGLRFKIFGKDKPHVRNILLQNYSYAPKPVVINKTVEKGDTEDVLVRLKTAEKMNEILKSKLEKLENK